MIDRPADLDPRALADLERRTAAVPGVRAAAAVARYRVRRDAGAGWAAPAGAAPAGAAPPPPAEPGGDDRRPGLADGGPLELGPDHPRTLQEALRRAADDGAGRGLTYVLPGGETDVQTYATLVHDAQRVLRGLRAIGLRPGQSVILHVDDARGFHTAFWACVLGGFLPAPVGVARDYSEDGAVTSKLRNAWHLLGRPPIVTGEAVRPALAGLARAWDAGEVRIEAVEDLGSGSEDAAWHPVDAGDLVLDLLTSGSTGVPKCVRHRNRSVASMARAWQLVNGFDERDVSLSWMPLDHVGATVMYHVRSVFQRCQHVSARTDAFLAKPLRWLDWIEQHRATDTWAPNFGFALIGEREDEVRGGRWDLSSVRFVCNGGEAVVSQTAHRFLRLLAPHGLRPDVMRPAWGMSETSSGVTFSRLDRDDESAGVRLVDKRTLTGRLRFLDAPSPAAVSFTEVGPPAPGVRLRIVDDRDRVRPEDAVGRLQVRGETMMDGYHANPDANLEAFTADGWFNTGDLAFLHAGSLTIAGREKDQIVVNGANYLCHEVEAVVERVEGVEVTWSAAAGIFDPERGSDRLAVFFVPSSADAEVRRQTAQEIRTALAREIGLQPDVVVPLERPEFPKTASGKIQRAELARALDAGRYDDRLGEQEADDEAGLPPWFFERVWRPARSAGHASPTGPTVMLITGDVSYTAGTAARVAAAGGELVPVWPGQALRRRDDGAYEMDPREPDQYDRLLAELERRHGRIGRFVHGWAATPWPAASPWAADGPDDLRDALVSGFFSVLWLLRALARRGWTDAELLVVTQGGLWVGEEDRVDARKGGLAGLVRTAAAEETVRSVRLVDLDPSTPDGWADLVAEELGIAGGDAVVARRAGARLAPRLRAVAAPETGPPPAAIEPGGLYLLTGGLGGLGYELAQYLLAAHRARLLIIGRRAVAEDDGSEAGERLADLRQLGEVRYARASVADRGAVEAAVVRAEQAWGRPLDGVLHLAGEALSGGWDDDLERHALPNETDEAFERAFEAKLHGTYALAHVLRERPRAELVLFSSVNGHFGGSGFGAYSAANSFLDLFAERWAGRERRPVRCLAWSMWSDVGMNRGNPTAEAARRRGFRAVDPERGLASFLVAMGLDRRYLAIGLDRGSAELLPELDTEQLEPVEVVVAYAAAGAGVPAGTLERETASERERAGGRVSFVRVPELPRLASGELDERALTGEIERRRSGGRSFEEPRTDLEAAVADVFREVLGAPAVGRQDSFFELHGNSVRAAQVMARLNARLGREHPLRTLYRHPTVRELADALSS